MTTSSATELIDDGGVDVRELPPGLDVIRLVREASERSSHGLAWAFYLDIADIRAPRLTIGLRAERGFVSWSDGRTTTHATGGTNTEHADYWNGGHHTQTAPGTEIDAEQVYAALGEFLRTHARPECVTWRELSRPVVDPFATGTINAREAENVPGRLRQIAESEPGRAWLVNVGDPGTVTQRNLTIGVRGDRGALVWGDPLDQGEAVPAHGLNAEPVEYTLARLIPRAMPPGAELPLDDALAAVAEYVRTGQRPTCVEWRACAR